MSTLRMTSDLRRQLILSAAKRCFARNGFAGTTTKSVAAAAAISEGLLFKHFPSKAALYAEILAEECEADPDSRTCSARSLQLPHWLNWSRAWLAISWKYPTVRIRKKRSGCG
jgi:AcrR family transcriptional regulator